MGSLRSWSLGVVVKQSVMKQVIAKYLTKNVGRGWGGSYRQVMFSYYKLWDYSTLA